MQHGAQAAQIGRSTELVDTADQQHLGRSGSAAVLPHQFDRLGSMAADNDVPIQKVPGQADTVTTDNAQYPAQCGEEKHRRQPKARDIELPRNLRVERAKPIERDHLQDVIRRIRPLKPGVRSKIEALADVEAPYGHQHADQHSPGKQQPGIAPIPPSQTVEPILLDWLHWNEPKKINGAVSAGLVRKFDVCSLPQSLWTPSTARIPAPSTRSMFKRLFEYAIPADKVVTPKYRGQRWRIAPRLNFVHFGPCSTKHQPAYREAVSSRISIFVGTGHYCSASTLPCLSTRVTLTICAVTIFCAVSAFW